MRYCAKHFICIFPYNLFFFLSFLGHTNDIWKFPGGRLNQSYSCQPTPQPQQHQIRAVSATDTTAHSNTGTLTHWEGPGNEPTFSWMPVGFINHWAATGTPSMFFLEAERIPHLLSTLVSFLIAQSVVLNYFHFPQNSELNIAGFQLIFLTVKGLRGFLFSPSSLFLSFLRKND